MMGAILACGILDAGGRNVTIKLVSGTNHDKMTAVIGLALFSQYWFWHPFTYFISLSFSVTAFIGVNYDIKVPKYDLLSNAKPSLFKYPPATSTSIGSTHPSGILPTTAVLSTTVKAAAAAAGRAKLKRSCTSYSLVKDMEEAEEEERVKEKEKEREKEEEKKKKAEEEEEEAGFEILRNPARVVPSQEKFIRYVEDSRYVAINYKWGSPCSGFVVLKDLRPTEPFEEVDLFQTSDAAAAPVLPLLFFSNTAAAAAVASEVVPGGEGGPTGGCVGI